MITNFDLTRIGVNYDNEIMQNIEDMLKSMKIEKLDAIGFVAKAGDAQLPAKQKYIFESILHIFGKDVQKNLNWILTNYYGQTVNILDSFNEETLGFNFHWILNIFTILLTSSSGILCNSLIWIYLITIK